MFRILLTEDDKNSARFLQITLTKAGYSVLTATNGKQALDMLESQHIDLIVLDIMMPEMDGFEFTETVRNHGIDTPILVVSAKQLSDDKCKALHIGADDFMSKPINEREFLLRIKALLRRANIISEQKISIGDVILDYSNLSVIRGDEVQTLPKKEFHLLFKLLSCPDKIFTRIQLMDEIWGVNTSSGDSTINVHINRLRKRFGNYPEFKIVALKGIGYKAVITNEKKQ